MVGGGPLEPTLRAQVAAAGVADRFTFVSGAIGPKVICAFDIFALPSAYEGMPYVLLEAAAAGLPTLATAVGGSRSVISHGRNGFVVSNWDAQEFATQLSYMIQNAQLRSEMGRESRKIGKRFTVERMVRETIDVYRTAIERRAPSRAAHGVTERGPSARPGAPHS
jgi:glycosyltransferase involved in cell wall biosynthesis